MTRDTRERYRRWSEVRARVLDARAIEPDAPLESPGYVSPEAQAFEGRDYVRTHRRDAYRAALARSLDTPALRALGAAALHPAAGDTCRRPDGTCDGSCEPPRAA